MGMHLAAIGLSVFLLKELDGLFSQGVVTLILGILLIFLFAPLHESIHKTAFATPWLNNITALFCGLVIMLPPRFFQCFHMAHHRYTQTQGQDPELDGEKPQTLGQYLWYVSGFRYWLEQIKAIAHFAMGKNQTHYVSQSRTSAVVNEARFFVGFYIVIISLGTVGGFDSIWKYWIIPVIVGQPFLRLFLLAEHTLCPKVKDMFSNTRTTLTNGLVRRLCWNMSYHVEHHAHPGLPFHQLPAAHEILRSNINVLSSGYIAVQRQIIKSFGA